MGKKPDFNVVSPKKTKNEKGEEKTLWVNIGSAWDNGEKGISIALNSLPLTDKLILFKVDSKDNKE